MQFGLKLLKYYILTQLNQLLKLLNIIYFCVIYSFSKTVLLIKFKIGLFVRK